MPSKPKSRNSKRAASKASSEVTCTALLVVDQAPFIKKALSTCRRLRKELDKKQALLYEFEENDRNAFERWLNKTQGKRLTQIRELHEAVNAHRFIMHHLSQCAYYDYKAVPDLYTELFERKEAGTLYEYVPPKQPDPFGFGEDEDDDEDEDEDDDDWDDDDWDDDEDDWDDDDEDMRDFFDRMFGGAGSSGGGESARGPSAQKAANDNARLKTCYRNLAKRLHPDRSELDERIREKRWHEIQAAYQNNDLEALERVEAVCDMDDAGLSADLGLARLRDLAAYHQSHLKPLRVALREAKKDIAFGFAAKGASDAVKRSVTKDLKEDQMEVKNMLDYLDDTAAAIRDQAVRQLREDEAAAERARRRAAAKKGKKAKVKTAAKKPMKKAAKQKVTSNKKDSDIADPDQMTFF